MLTMAATTLNDTDTKDQVLVVSSLKWPSSPKRVTIQCAGSSFLEYHYRKYEQTKVEILDYVRSQSSSTVVVTSVTSSSTTVEEASVIKKEKKQKNLFHVSEEKLSKMSYYDILHVPMTTNGDGLKRAYHKACLKYHPDKSGRGEDDYVFLAIKNAFDTLSDADKRRSYDSTVDFDESIPPAGELFPSHLFYSTYGPVFQRNLRFAVRSESKGGNGGNNNKGNRNNKGGNTTSKEVETVTLLGDDTTPIEQVNAFYDYWTHFESWRDFTLKAQELTKHDLDSADNRDEKRWMAKEVDRKAKVLKKQEVARIAMLVERAMAADPRLRRHREQERLAKERVREERQAKQRQMDQEKKQKEEQERKLQNERDEVERIQKAKEKIEKEKQKKELRKSRQLLRKLSIHAYENQNSAAELWESLEHLNDDVEMLCDKLALEHLNALIESLQQDASQSSTQIQLAEDAIDIFGHHIRKVKGVAEEDQIVQQMRREEIRKVAAEKDALEKAASASKPWSKAELSCLAKAVKKFPAGGANRWESISLFINNTLSLSDLRSKEECIAQYNQTLRNVVSSAGGGTDSSNNAGTSPTAGKAHDANSLKENVISLIPGCDWTTEQDALLQEGLKKYPSTMEKNERWTNIAKEVPGKGKKECVQRFKEIREALVKNKK